LKPLGGGLIIANFFCFHVHHHFTFAKHFFLYLIIIELSIMLLTGGIATTGIFWFFVFPAPAFYLEGKKNGLIWMVILTLTIILTTYLSQESYITIPYPLITIRQMVISLYVVAALTYYFQVSRERAQSGEQLIKKNLQESHERLMVIERIAHIGIWQWNFADDQLLWSEEVFRFHFLPPQSKPFPSTTFFNLLPTDTAQSTREKFSNALTSRNPFSFEYSFSTKENGQRSIKCQGETRLDEHGKPLHLFGTLQDITIEKELEKQITIRAEELEKMNNIMIGRELKMAELKKKLLKKA
jgi:PAS domain-containing protein